MSNQSTAAPEAYLPAGLQLSTEPGPVERLLTKPFRRVYAAWLPAE